MKKYLKTFLFIVLLATMFNTSWVFAANNSVKEGTAATEAIYKPLINVDTVVDYELYTVYTDLGTLETWSETSYYYKTISYNNGYDSSPVPPEIISSTYDPESNLQTVVYKISYIYTTY